MHNFILKIFGFVKSLIHFLKIVVVVLVMLTLLVWIQNLISAHWSWLSIFDGVLGSVISIASQINNNSINLFGALFEFKYIIAIGLYWIGFYLCDLLSYAVNSFELDYMDIRDDIKKLKEDAYNKGLARDIHNSERKITNYKVFIQTSLKEMPLGYENNLDIKALNVEMNKFLMSNTGVAPLAFDDGFLYSFPNFEKIDDVLALLFKLIKSKAPLNYVLCVQVVSEQESVALKQLQKLRTLKFVNKISMFSDTAYRYSHNNVKEYRTSQLGLFKFEEGTLEAHEFLERQKEV